MVNQNLPAPTITPNNGVFCGGVNFKIAKPSGWTEAQWSAFNSANITSATLGGSSYPGTLAFDGTSYYYYIAASSAAYQTASITVGGSIGATAVTSSGQVSVQVRTNMENSFSVDGISCFDINRSNIQGRNKADFNINYTYLLSGTLGTGVMISSVVWSYTNTNNAVRAFTSSNTSSTVANNQVAVRYNPALLSDATIGMGGITVTLTATITTTGGSCNAVYQAKRDVRIKDASCCPGVVIPGGVHANSTRRVPNHTIYDNLGTLGFIRDASKDLCVYYRDGSAKYDWNNAVNGCKNGLLVDAAHKSMKWRLPNLAELGQMHSEGATTATWTPNYDALASDPGAYSGTVNMHRDYYWSITEYSTAYAVVWRYSNIGALYIEKTRTNYVRCVSTMD